MQVDKEKSKEQKALLYDQFADGKISWEEFKKRQEAITRLQDDLQQRYDTLQRECHISNVLRMQGRCRKSNGKIRSIVELFKIR